MTMQSLVLAAQGPAEAMEADAIAPLAHAEASLLAGAVFERFLALLETLAPDDWERPTYCSEWTVRDMVAHQAGAYESGTSLGAFARQWLRPPTGGRALLDSVNDRQIRGRAGLTPAELIAELQDVGPRAIAARSRLSPIVRSIPIPIPPLGLCRAGYLTDALYVRDTWIHAVDICHATGRPLALTPEPDGRFVALIVRDLAPRLAGALGGASVDFDLTGPAGGRYRIGTASAPAAMIRLDAVDFNLRASARITAAEALARSEVTGDAHLGRRALESVFVVY